MRYEDLWDIVIEINYARHHLKENEKLCVRVDVDTHSYYEGVLRDTTIQERTLKVITTKSTKFIDIQHIVAVSYWTDNNPIEE